MRLLFALALIPLVSGCLSAVTPSPGLQADLGTSSLGEPPRVASVEPTPAPSPAEGEGSASTERGEADGSDAPAAESSPRPFSVSWDGGFGEAVWVSGEYDVAGCYCWLAKAGETSATLQGGMEPGTWTGSIVLTWDSTASPTLDRLVINVGTYHECMECPDAVQSSKVSGTSPLRVHLPRSGPEADRFWITVSQPEVARQHIASGLQFHVEGTIAPPVGSATPN